MGQTTRRDFLTASVMTFSGTLLAATPAAASTAPAGGELWKREVQGR